MIAKFDKFGTPLWQVKAGGTGDDVAHAVVVDNLGNIYVTGSTNSGNCVFYGATNFTISAANKKYFLAKYDANGDVLWVKTVLGSGSGEGLTLTIDNTNVYVGGYFTNTFAFPSSSSLVSSGDEDMFIASYDFSGNINWAQKEGGSGDDRCTGIANNINRLFISGYAENGITYSGTPNIVLPSIGFGGTNISIACFDKSGNVIWGKLEGNSNNCSANSVTVLKGKVLIGGSYIGNMTYNSTPVPAISNNDMFLSTYDLSGSFQSIKHLATAGDEVVYAVASDFRHFYITGKYSNTLNFGGTSGTAASSSDMFLACYDTLFNLNFVKFATGTSTNQALACHANQNGCVSLTGTFKSTTIQFAPLTVYSPWSSGSSEDLWISNINTCNTITSNSISTTQTICAGTSPATLTGSTPIGGNNIYAYIWEQSNNGITWTNAVGTNSLISYSPPTLTTTVYYRRIVNSCSETSTSNSITIQVNQPPSISFAGIDQTNLCGVNSTNLSANTPTSGVGSWSVISGSGGTISAVTNPNSSFSGISGVNYVLRWTIINSPCLSSIDDVNILFNSNPTITVATSSSTICNGQTATLTASGANTYSWASGPASAVYTVNTAGTYTVTGTDINNCTNTKTIGITVNQNPTVTIVPSSSTICNGQTATLTANGANTYTWTSGPASAAYTVNTSGTYTVTGTDINNCTNTKTIGITVNQNPTVTIVPSSSTICNGQTATLTASGANTYSWTSGPASAVYTVNTTGTYTVTGTDINNCTNTKTISLTINPNPTVTIVPSSSTICNGQTATLTASGANTYSWTSGPANAIYTVNTTGTYTVTGTDINNCTNTKTIGITVNQNPTVTIVPSSSAICNGQTATLTASGANTYTWASGPASSVYTVNTTGVYTVTGSNSNNCLSSTSFSFNVYTNPVISISNTVVCAGSQYTLNPTGAISYTYSSGSSIISPTSTSIYSITGVNAQGCSGFNTVTVSVDQPPSPASAGSDIVTNLSSVVLSGNAPAQGIGEWILLTNGGTLVNSTNPNTEFLNIPEGTNTLVWKISNGICPFSSDTLSVIRRDIVIPQLITPNNDGNNDYLFINTIEKTEHVSIEIYDRWGRLVYKNDEYKNEFNGRNDNNQNLVDDTYFMILKIPNDNTYKAFFTIKRQ